MKKLLSVILVATMLFTVMAPIASASEIFEPGKTPIIYIRGNGEPLYYPDGSRLVATFEDLNLGGEDSAESSIDKDTIVETAVNILKPFIMEGMIFDQWDNYGKTIYEEISPLFVDAGLIYGSQYSCEIPAGNPKISKIISKVFEKIISDCLHSNVIFL